MILGECRVGDKVFLNSGGPTMIIASTDQHLAHSLRHPYYVLCIWSDGFENLNGWFVPETLTKEK